MFTSTPEDNLASKSLIREKINTIFLYAMFLLTAIFIVTRIFIMGSEATNLAGVEQNVVYSIQVVLAVALFT
ncbi:MAG: hypothetical protein QM640_01405 [Niabella sp.]